MGNQAGIGLLVDYFNSEFLLDTGHGFDEG